MLTFAIGDIHGRLDLLELALAEIAEYPGLKRIVFLGDYVDRGPDSAGVVERLMGLSSLGTEYVFLKGNHEDLMLAAFDDPSQRYMWEMNGAKSTWLSYTNENYIDMDRINKHLQWMESLQLMFKDELGRVFVHAGIDPRRGLEFQDAQTLMWVRQVFLDVSELEAYIVHGHTHTHSNKRTSEYEDLPHRCNLDTAAYHTGLLSVAVFEDHQIQPTSIFQVSK
jgi:serine/threonine protein phosphatase 1